MSIGKVEKGQTSILKKDAIAKGNLKQMLELSMEIAVVESLAGGGGWRRGGRLMVGVPSVQTLQPRPRSRILLPF